MSSIEIGRSGGKPVNIDLEVLLRTRLLIQANSGGGKSWLLRRLAEQLSGQAQVLVIDPEGEFATLREHFPFILVGRGGDTPADVRSAGLVAHKLLELGVSAVCDLFEMKVGDRHAWVAAFLTALIDAPKTLWHPAVVMVDECHVFAPERGAGESEASEGVAALATRGRKRGFCLVAATQRLGKLRKDVAAELQNVLIGPTFLDLDRDRAAEVLGIPRADRKEFDHDVKVMPPGQFFALGRAVSTDRIRLTVGPVVSSHPEPGSSKHSAEPPPPPDKIRHLLAKLGDLPKEAERKAQTEAELRAEVDRLRHELATSPGRADMLARISEDAENLAAELQARRKQLAELEGVTGAEVRRLRAMEQRFETVIQAVDDYRKEGGGRWARTEDESARQPHPGRALLVDRSDFSHDVPSPPPRRAADVNGQRITNLRPLNKAEQEDREHALRISDFRAVPTSQEDLFRPGDARQTSGMPTATRRILTALAQSGPRLTRRKLAIVTGYPPSGSSIRNNLSICRGSAWITDVGDDIEITPAGRKALGEFTPLPTGRALIDYWMRELPEASAKILTACIAAHPKPVTRVRLAELTGYPEGGSTIRNNLSKLRGLELVEDVGDDIKAADELLQGARR